MTRTRKEHRKFNSIWWRAGGFTISRDGTVSLNGRRTNANLKYQRSQRFRGIHEKYPSRSERRWWHRVANMDDFEALI
jgi:hypothetical protein